MIIRVKIGSTSNKGDEMMLRAICERLGQGHRLLVESGRIDERLRKELGLYRLLGDDVSGPVLFCKRLVSRPARTVRATVHDMALRPRRFSAGYATAGDAAALMDASGYVYGDAWGPSRAVQMARVFEAYQRRGRPVVLLPQSFGPFTDPELSDAFRRLMDHVDLAYARDRQSFEHIVALIGDDERVRQAPDYTYPVAGVMPDGELGRRDYACIIPNHRMLDSTSGETGHRYLSFLQDCVQAVTNYGLCPVIVLHDVKHDNELAMALQDRVGHKLEIVAEKDARRVKGVIGGGRLLISSRFHGLMNGLSQGIPCIATEWTHKFRELMRSYGCEDYLVSPLESPIELNAKIGRLVEGPEREAALAAIKQASRRMEARVLLMWQEIEQVLPMDR